MEEKGGYVMERNCIFESQGIISSQEPTGVMIRTCTYFLFSILILSGCRHSSPSFEAMAWRDTSSSHIEVFMMDGGQVLRVNGIVKDVIDTTDRTSVSRYIPVMDIPRQYFDTNGVALLANIGSGAIVRNYGNAGWHIDVAEPDSAILHAAITAFRTTLPESSLFRESGREFLSHTANTYDIILVDGVASSALPTAMMTREFFELAEQHLRTRGLLAIAVESVGWHDGIVQSLGRTLQELFKKVTVLPVAEPPNTFGGIVLLATDVPRNLSAEPERNIEFDPEWRYGAGYQRTHALDNSFTPDPGAGRVLTDATSRFDTIFTRIIDSARVQSSHFVP